MGPEFLNRPIRAVTFDVGGTLMEPWPSVGQVYADAARDHGFSGLNPEEISARFGAAWKAEAGFNHSRTGWRSIVGRTFEGLVPETCLEALFADLYERFARPEAWRVFEDVRPTLDALHAMGLKLGVLSNWDERLRPLLDRLDLTARFESIVVSCEVSATKPAAAIFERAAVSLGLEPGEILHVGDRPEEDVQGAQAAGFAGLLVDRQAGNVWGVNTLRTLPAALAALRFNSPSD